MPDVKGCRDWQNINWNFWDINAPTELACPQGLPQLNPLLVPAKVFETSHVGVTSQRLVVTCSRAEPALVLFAKFSGETGASYEPGTSPPLQVHQMSHGLPHRGWLHCGRIPHPPRPQHRVSGPLRTPQVGPAPPACPHQLVLRVCERWASQTSMVWWLQSTPAVFTPNTHLWLVRCYVVGKVASDLE